MIGVLLLPGVIAPASVRYAGLLPHLERAHVLLKELEVYAADAPPPGYSIATEVAGIDEAADRAHLERFHLFGHSGGASCALAYAAAHPERVASLALDEPPTAFTDADHSDPYWGQIAAAQAQDGQESLAAFLRLQLAPGVPLPPPPEGPTPPWMTTRSAGIRAFLHALGEHRVELRSYQAFPGPVLFTHGSLSHPRWLVIRDRLAAVFPDFSSEQFAGLHHLHSPDEAEPARVASLLADLWARAELS